MMKATLPKGLGPKARKLWRTVTAEYELTAIEVQVLEQLCREVDLVETRLLPALTNGDIFVEGSKGQMVANPLLQEIRQHRALISQLGMRLNLPEEDGGTQAASRSASARELARARWSM